MSVMAMGQFILKTRMGGVPVRIHWSILLALPFAWAVGRGALFAITAFVSFVALMLAHEFGHAWLARRFGLKVFSIEIYPFHGLCRFEEPFSSVEHYLICWGGIAAQAVLFAVFAIVQVVMREFPDAAPRFLVPILLPIVAVFTSLNLFTALFNLLPIGGLDGYHAWKIIPACLNGELRAYLGARKSLARMRRR